MIESVRNLPAETIKNFRATGKSEIIPYEVQQYIRQLDRSVELFRIDSNVSRTANKLLAEFPQDLHAESTARSRVYDAINLFYLNNTVTNLAWNMLTADKMEDLGRLALADGNITEARRCWEKAHMYRTQHDSNAYDPEKMKRVDIIVSPDVTHERLGITRRAKDKMWKDIDGLIENPKLDLTDEDKLRLKEEAARAINVDTIDISHEDL